MLCALDASRTSGVQRETHVVPTASPKGAMQARLALPGDCGGEDPMSHNLPHQVAAHAVELILAKAAREQVAPH